MSMIDRRRVGERPLAGGHPPLALMKPGSPATRRPQSLLRPPPAVDSTASAQQLRVGLQAAAVAIGATRRSKQHAWHRFIWLRLRMLPVCSCVRNLPVSRSNGPRREQPLHLGFWQLQHCWCRRAPHARALEHGHQHIVARDLVHVVGRRQPLAAGLVGCCCRRVDHCSPWCRARCPPQPP